MGYLVESDDTEASPDFSAIADNTCPLTHPLCKLYALQEIGLVSTSMTCLAEIAENQRDPFRNTKR